MTIILKPDKKAAIQSQHNHYFKTMIKAVVDVDRGIIAIDAELHADLENALLIEGSVQENLWGINLFLGKPKQNWIEYTALINIRPSMNNRSMEVEDPEMKKKIKTIVENLILE